MAKNNNLTDFLTDVADAIREKDGSTGTINPQDFSDKIKAIPTGVDTSDATATSADILKNKTAYVKGAKVTGAIETYDGTVEDVSTIRQIPITKTADNYSQISGLKNDKMYTIFWDYTSDIETMVIRYGAQGVWIESYDRIVSQTEDSVTFHVGSGNYLYGWEKAAAYEADRKLTTADFQPLGTLIDSFTQTLASWRCMVEGTQITLADGTKKPIQDITYNDDLLVWNFYEGKFDTAKPCWIKIPQVTPEYNLCKFSNGAEVGFVGKGGNTGYHRIYNDEAKCFTHTGVAETPIGTTTFAEDMSMPTLIEQEVVKKEVKYYNIITDKHFNLFANGILTSCKLSNKYAIENMKYVGEQLITDEEERAYFERIENIRA